MAVRAPVDVAGGPGVAETVRLLKTLAHALDALRHDRTGRVAGEPRMEVKAMLAAQAHDLVLAAGELRARAAELPPAPEPAIAEPISRRAALQLAHAHLRRAQPAVDEPTVRALTALALTLERHLDEDGDVVPSPETHPLPAQPAREPFVTVGAPGDGGLHDLIHAKLCRAELAAHESHTDPAADHHHLARVAADCTRHALLIDRAAGGVWGAHGVAAGYVTEAPPLPEEPRSIFDFVRADEARHQR